MLDTRRALAGAVAVLMAAYAVYWFRRVRRQGKNAAGPARPTAVQVGLGAVTNFFDTLGIGSFAPTTSVFKLRRMLPDELIPGTLNVGHTLPTMLQAFIFIAIVKVELPTLIGMILASVLGAWLGAGVVAGLSRRAVQIGMGFALLAAATFFAMTNLGLFPAGGSTLGLSPGMLAVGVAGNFVLGALMSLGIGLYAPCMILVALLGMDPQAAFPIMMGSCAFLMPFGSARFIRKGSYRLGPALGLAIGGIPAVLVAAYLVKSLPLTMLRWLVVAVVAYTSAAMLRSAMSKREGPGLQPGDVPDPH